MTERRITDRPMDAEGVVYWLERAGITLRALPDYSPRLEVRLMSVELQMAAEMARREAGLLRPSISAEDIDAMDVAFGWLPLIDNRVRRRIVCARSLVHPLNGRHLYPFSRIGELVGAHKDAVRRWHAQGIAEIVAGIAAREGRKLAA